MSEQLLLFLQSIALGAALALVYDLLGALRSLGGRVWGGALDVLFCLTSVAAVFIFVMAGDGELRVFIVLGTVGGAVLFWCLLSGLLRPVWAFWLTLALAPARLAGELLKKCGRGAKKSCTFLKKWVTIKYNTFRKRISPPESREGDEDMAAASAGKSVHAQKKKQKAEKTPKASGKLTMFLIVILLAFLSVQIFNMFDQLQSARAEEKSYAQQLEELKETNQNLREDLDNSESLDLIEDIARDQLGMVREGEKVFHYSN